MARAALLYLDRHKLRDDSNNNSVEVRLDYGDTSFLFTGDAESKEEKDIIAANEDLDCDVLSVGHHGSASSTSWDFFGAGTSRICSYFLLV